MWQKKIAAIRISMGLRIKGFQNARKIMGNPLEIL
jgi:hypothetical protein